MRTIRSDSLCQIARGPWSRSRTDEEFLQAVVPILRFTEQFQRQLIKNNGKLAATGNCFTSDRAHSMPAFEISHDGVVIHVCKSVHRQRRCVLGNNCVALTNSMHSSCNLEATTTVTAMHHWHFHTFVKMLPASGRFCTIDVNVIETEKVIWFFIIHY